MTKEHSMQITCECGGVKLGLQGTPILTALCYCDDCQQGSKNLEKLSGAPPVREADGSTAYVLWRKDRVEVLDGEELIEEHQLREDAPTDRVTASCCNTAMYLNFRKGHWFTLYRRRFANPPPLEMGVYTKFMDGFDEDTAVVRSYRTFPLRFIGKVALARLAMIFGR